MNSSLRGGSNRNVFRKNLQKPDKSNRKFPKSKALKIEPKLSKIKQIESKPLKIESKLLIIE